MYKENLQREKLKFSVQQIRGNINLYIKIKRSQLHKPIEILYRKINCTN